MISQIFSLGLHFANKIRNLHVNYRNQIMKVYLATQLFSSSVADAIEFLDETLHLPDFKHSQGTVEFIRIMNDVFDIFNSRQMSDTFYKQPLHKDNFKFVMKRLDQAKKYLLSITDLEKRPVYVGPRYTFVLGILILIESLKGYYRKFVEKEKLLTFIPTYKQSQDSVEMFNCSMRSFHGYNTNPTAVIFKKSLIHVQFQEKFSGNCVPLESIPILNCKSAKSSVEEDTFICDEYFEQSIENTLFFRGYKTNFEAYHNVIAHISGYIGRRLHTILRCDACSQSVLHVVTEEKLSQNEDDEDHGYDDVIYGEDIDGIYDESHSHVNISAFRNNTNDQRDSAEFDIIAIMDGVIFTDDTQTDYDCDNEYGYDDSAIDDENTYFSDDEQADLSQPTIDEGEISTTRASI